MFVWRQWANGVPVKLPADKTVNGVPVFFFRTYVGAARKAYKAGLIGEDEFLRVVKKAQKELSGVPKEDLKWADLTTDVELAIIAMSLKISPPTAGKVPAAAAPAVAMAGGGGQQKSWFDSLFGR